MRPSLPVQRLSAATFHEAVGTAPWLLVRVEPGLPRLHRGLARFFGSQYPGLFSFGTLPIKETRARGWWDRHFRTAVGPVKGSHTGYFLLQEGEVVGQHSGQIRADLSFSDPRETYEDRKRGHAELAWIQKIAFGDRPVSSVDLAAAVELIAYFDGVVFERQNRAGYGREGAGSSRSGGQSGAIAPQDVPIPGASRDPFEVLKVPFDATDAEIKAAYKLQMKLNHPDKLTHMSDDIQAYAHAQVRVIRAAWDAIRSVRSGGTSD